MISNVKYYACTLCFRPQSFYDTHSLGRTIFPSKVPLELFWQKSMLRKCSLGPTHRYGDADRPSLLRILCKGHVIKVLRIRLGNTNLRKGQDGPSRIIPKRCWTQKVIQTLKNISDRWKSKGTDCSLPCIIKKMHSKILLFYISVSKELDKTAVATWHIYSTQIMPFGLFCLSSQDFPKQVLTSF